MGTDILEDTTGPHHTLTRAEKYKIQKIHHNYMSRNKSCWMKFTGFWFQCRAGGDLHRTIGCKLRKGFQMFKTLRFIDE